MRYDVHDKPFRSSMTHLQAYIVQAQKHDGARERGTFVSVMESMRQSYRDQVRRRLGEQVRVERLSPVARLRLMDSRVQHVVVQDTTRAAVTRDALVVDLDDFFHRKEAYGTTPHRPANASNTSS